MKTLLKFSAPWCQSCNALSTVLKPINLDSVNLVEVDIDKEQDMVHLHKIRSIPTLVLLDEVGTEIKRSTDIKTKNKALQFLGFIE